MVYIDDAKVLRHGHKWFHLTADSLDELHEFAAAIGVATRAFHVGARHPHYDVTESQRRRAIRYGALAVTSRDIVRIAKHIENPSRELLFKEQQFCLFL